MMMTTLMFIIDKPCRPDLYAIRCHPECWQGSGCQSTLPQQLEEKPTVSASAVPPHHWVHDAIKQWQYVLHKLRSPEQPSAESDMTTFKAVFVLSAKWETQSGKEDEWLREGEGQQEGQGSCVTWGWQWCCCSLGDCAVARTHDYYFTSDICV